MSFGRHSLAIAIFSLGCGPGAGGGDGDSAGSGGGGSSATTSAGTGGVGDTGTAGAECGDGIAVSGVFCFHEPLLAVDGLTDIREATGPFLGNGREQLLYIKTSTDTVMLGWDGAAMAQLWPAGPRDIGGGGAIAPTLGDFNGDGRLDAVRLHGDEGVQRYVNNGTTVVYVDDSPLPEKVDDFVRAFAVDLGADGVMDLALTSAAQVQQPKTRIFESTGDGFALTELELHPPGCNFGLRIVRGEFGSGTGEDLAIIGEPFGACRDPLPPEATDAPVIVIMHNRPQQRGFIEVAEVPSPFFDAEFPDLVAWPADLKVGDFDGDGDDDLVTYGGRPSGLIVHWNNGGGVFASDTMIGGLNLLGSRPIDVGDLDGDGDAEIVFGTKDDQIRALTDPADPSQVLELAHERIGNPTVADLNGDGVADIHHSNIGVILSNP